MSLFKNASPEFIPLGADDKSIKTPDIERDATPQISPLFYFYGEKGNTKKIQLPAGDFVNFYGSKTFDPNSEFYNYSTRFLLGMSGTGTLCNLKRVVPSDAGVRSNMNIYIDIVEDDVPNYIRNSKGEYVINSSTNDYEIDTTTPTIRGYKIKFIKEVTDKEVEFGLLKSKEGTMVGVDSKGSTITSTMYPFLEVKARYQGRYYNNIGFSIKSIFGDDLDQDIVHSTKSLPFKLALYNRVDETHTPKVFRTLYGEPDVMFSFKEKAINPLTDARFDFGTVFKNNWFNETDPNKDIVYSDYEGIYLYRDNLSKVSGLVATSEAPYITSTDSVWNDNKSANTLSWFDFTTDTNKDIINNEKLLINILAGKSSKNINYFTLVMDKSSPNLIKGQKEISFSTNTPVMLEGGSNGTMTNDEFEKLVVEDIRKYADKNSEYMDLALNTDTLLIDPGFSLKTKYALVDYINKRKDTIIMFSTHDAQLGSKSLSLSEQRSIGVAIRTKLRLVPESDYYGTGVARGVIVVGTGSIRDGSSEDRLPLTYDSGIKVCSMMGAGDFKWKAEKSFNRAPGSIIDTLTDIQPAFIPSGIKPTIWSDGLVWAQPYDRTRYQFPGIQTVYDNDTSVLNTLPVIVAMSAATRVAAAAWREFTGSTDLSNAEFIEAVTNYLSNNLQGIFAGIIHVIPEVVITGGDAKRGYIWRTINKIGANNMKTKMVYSSEIYRMEDL